MLVHSGAEVPLGQENSQVHDIMTSRGKRRKRESLVWHLRVHGKCIQATGKLLQHAKLVNDQPQHQ